MDRRNLDHFRPGKRDSLPPRRDAAAAAAAAAPAAAAAAAAAGGIGIQPWVSCRHWVLSDHHHLAPPPPPVALQLPQRAAAAAKTLQDTGSLKWGQMQIHDKNQRENEGSGGVCICQQRPSALEQFFLGKI